MFNRSRKLERKSPCKINLLLSVLGKRPDGFHEVEMIMHPAPVFDILYFDRIQEGVQLTCSDPRLPTDHGNLVYQAAVRFFAAVPGTDGVRIHLEKHIPFAAGLGGGSSNAATTLGVLNEMFGNPLSSAQLFELAAGLGSDVPFFLQSQPAAAFGRGERIEPQPFFKVFQDVWLVLVHPGFGVATPWAYRELGKFPQALNGPRVRQFLHILESGDLESVGKALYNSLEAPVLRKFPVLALYKEFFNEHGAVGSLMSGSGSTTFALVRNEADGRDLLEDFQERFGREGWSAVVRMNEN